MSVNTFCTPATGPPVLVFPFRQKIVLMDRGILPGGSRAFTLPLYKINEIY